jgi:hypothetical protein
VASLSWRWIFYVNVPVCVAGLALAWRGLRSAGRPGRAERAAAPCLDWAGLALLSPGIAAILYGLAQVSTDGSVGDVAVPGPVLAGLAAVALFTLRASRQRPVPASPVPASPCRPAPVRPGPRRTAAVQTFWWCLAATALGLLPALLLRGSSGPASLGVRGSGSADGAATRTAGSRR